MRVSSRRRFLHFVSGAAVLPSFSPIALAEEFPSRPVRLIVGFTPGAASDIIARLFARAAKPSLGQEIIVDNKPGASGSIAGLYVAHAANDGYTCFLFALSTLTSEVAKATPSLDVMKDLTPIARLASGPLVLVVNPASGVKNVPDLIALAKSKPGDLLYGSTGVGSLLHFSAELFAQRTGIKLTHVPYPGSPQIVNDLMAGRITMSINIASAMMGQIAAGQLTPLATAAAKRAKALPDVPTMAEVGISDFDTSLWLGLMAPTGTPRPVIEKLAEAAHKAMQSPDAVEALRMQGYEPLEAGPDEFGAFIRDESTRWSEVARAAGLKS